MPHKSISLPSLLVIVAYWESVESGYTVTPVRVGWIAFATLMFSKLAAVAPALSVTWMTKMKAPVAVGDPEMVPPFRLRPVGSAPTETLQLYGGVPPLAWRLELYEELRLPTGSDLVCIVRGALETIRVALPVTVALPDPTLAVTVADPVATPVANPLWLTVDTAILDEDQAAVFVRSTVLLSL